MSKIFDGTKLFEFRKSIFKDKSVKTVVVYATRPVSMIVGEFDIDDIICGTPTAVWARTSFYSGITKIFFDEYFMNRDVAYAISIGAVREYEQPLQPSAIFPDFVAPQSYLYINDQSPSEAWRGQMTLSF
ncbi:MAG TPA: hypothetical protein VIQ29_18365 [Ancylobacter sp.]